MMPTATTARTMTMAAAQFHSPLRRCVRRLLRRRVFALKPMSASALCAFPLERRCRRGTYAAVSNVRTDARAVGRGRGRRSDDGAVAQPNDDLHRALVRAGRERLSYTSSARSGRSGDWRPRQFHLYGMGAVRAHDATAPASRIDLRAILADVEDCERAYDRGDGDASAYARIERVSRGLTTRRTSSRHTTATHFRPRPLTTINGARIFCASALSSRRCSFCPTAYRYRRTSQRAR